MPLFVQIYSRFSIFSRSNLFAKLAQKLLQNCAEKWYFCHSVTKKSTNQRIVRSLYSNCPVTGKRWMLFWQNEKTFTFFCHRNGSLTDNKTQALWPIALFLLFKFIRVILQPSHFIEDHNAVNRSLLYRIRIHPRRGKGLYQGVFTPIEIVVPRK